MSRRLRTRSCCIHEASKGCTSPAVVRHVSARCQAGTCCRQDAGLLQRQHVVVDLDSDPLRHKRPRLQHWIGCVWLGRPEADGRKLLPAQTHKFITLGVKCHR